MFGMQHKKLDFEKYADYLLLEVKFNGAGTTIYNQTDNFIGDFVRENEGRPGFDDVTLHCAIACASGKNENYLKEPFEFLIYINDGLEDYKINGVDYINYIFQIKNEGFAGPQNYGIDELSEKLEVIFANVVAEVCSGLGFSEAEMSDVVLGYQVFDDNRAPEIDVLVGFRDRQIYELFCDALESKYYISIVRRKI